MKNNFLGKKILVLTAHPDDESYAAAGTIYENYKKGGQTILVCATSGEKGVSHLKKSVRKKELINIRMKELRKAAKILHLKRIYFLNIKDGEVIKNIEEVYGKTLKVALKEKVEAIWSFDETGLSGHKDHIATGKIAKKISKKLHFPLLCFTLPPKFNKEARLWLKNKKVRHYVKSITFRKPDLTIKINPRIKKQALKCHQSQTENKKAFTGYPAYAVRELLKKEYFRKF